MPRSVLAELAAGRGGVAAVTWLRAAQHSKILLLVRALLLLVRETAHPDRAVVETAYRVLAEVPTPDRVAALSHPPVAAWAFGTVSLLETGNASAAHPGLLAAVAVTAAVRAGTEATSRWLPAPTAGWICRASAR